MMAAHKDSAEGQPVSVDDTIDAVAREALAEARRREELQRMFERETRGVKKPR